MAGGWVVTNLRAQMKVLRKSSAGVQLMEPSGFGEDGRPLTQPSTRSVTVSNGEPLPADLADGELERLISLDAVRQIGTATPEPEPETEPDSELDELLKQGVKQILDTVGDDKELAERVLTAEQAASKGDPRSTLVEGLEKVIQGGDGP